MKNILKTNRHSIWLRISTQALLSAALVSAMVTPNNRTFASGEHAKLSGIIISHEGSVVKIRGEDDAVATVNVTDATKIQMKHGLFGFSKTSMDMEKLLPGLRVQAEGSGNEKGELVADKVIFDPSSMKSSRAIDTRVSPLEGRQGQLEGREGQLEGRAGQLEGRAVALDKRTGELEDTSKQTQLQVGQARSEAEKANQGVNDVNTRVGDLDKYTEKYSATVYFNINSATLSAEAKKDLDDVAQKAQSEKGFAVEVAGFADKTGNLAANQALSDRRAMAVTQYLEQQGNVPQRRILTPAAMGISHEAADNTTRQGRKMNRRVEVKVLVNNGMVGGNASNAPATGTPAAPTTNPPSGAAPQK